MPQHLSTIISAAYDAAAAKIINLQLLTKELSKKMSTEIAKKVWHNGNFVEWNDANIHVMSHVVHYGSAVFEGIRCYATPQGPAVFR